MTAVIWFAAGVLVGVNVGLLHAWLTLRRANRKAAHKPFPLQGVSTTSAHSLTPEQMQVIRSHNIRSIQRGQW